MFDQKTICSIVVDILGRDSFPLHFELLVKRVLVSAAAAQGGNIEDLYSPFKTYVSGKRLYHLDPHINQWFTVCRTTGKDRILVRLDSGIERELPHSQQPRKNKTKYWYTPENAPKVVSGAVMELGCAGTVVKFGQHYVLKSQIDKVPFDKLSSWPALSKLRQLRESAQTPAGLAHAQSQRDTLVQFYRNNCPHYLYYIAPVDNLPSILERGILARNLAPDVRKSFADEEIQKKRHKICPDARLGLNLHDYVPLFFAPKPPLLYARRDEQESLVYLCINPGVLLEPGVVFSATNAVSADIFYRHVSDLDKLNWDILHADYWGSDDPFEKKSNKLSRQAEAEIPIYVAPDSILEIVVLNRGVAEDVIQLLNQSSRTIPVRIGPEYYCKC